jgi:glycosyltransferase involved in cell wall biosynthesis
LRRHRCAASEDVRVAEPNEHIVADRGSPAPRIQPKILFLGDHFGYPGGVAHGVTGYFLNVLPALSRAGVNFSVCFLREPHPAADALRACGIEPRFLSAGALNPFVVFQSAVLARRSGCSLIHAAGLKATLVARIVGRLIDVPVIVHVHDLNWPGFFLRRLQRAFARPTDLGIGVSRAVSRVMIEGYSVPRARARVVHNGIQLDSVRNLPVDTRARLRAALGLAESTPVLAMVGRMYPVKGHRGMLQIMALVAAACPQAVLLLIGDGPERGACEALVAKLGLGDKVRFLGHRGDVPQLLSAADLLVMPSLSEGLPLAAIEAMAAGRPVVGFDAGGMSEVVTDGVNGRVVAPNDHAAFATAVVALVQDRALLHRFAESARLDAERFSLPRHIEGLLACYAELAATTAAAPLAA